MNWELYEVMSLISNKFVTIKTCGGPVGAVARLCHFKCPQYETLNKDDRIVWDKNKPENKYRARRIT